LNTNNLNGSIPTELGKLTSLQFLYFFLFLPFLSSFLKRKGELILLHCLGHWMSISWLELFQLNSETWHLWLHCSFSFPFLFFPLPLPLPYSLTKYNQSNRDLDTNQLNGTIPTEIGKLTSLTYLFVYIYQFASFLLCLTSFFFDRDLDTNQITGAIPTELGNLILLTDLFVSFFPKSKNEHKIQKQYTFLILTKKKKLQGS